MNDRDIQGPPVETARPRLLDLAREAIRRRRYSHPHARLRIFDVRKRSPARATCTSRGTLCQTTTGTCTDEQGSKRLIYGSSIFEMSGDVGFEHHDIAALMIPFVILATNGVREIVLRAHLVHRFSALRIRSFFGMHGGLDPIR